MRKGQSAEREPTRGGARVAMAIHITQRPVRVTVSEVTQRAAAAASERVGG